MGEAAGEAAAATTKGWSPLTARNGTGTGSKVKYIEDEEIDDQHSGLRIKEAIRKHDLIRWRWRRGTRMQGSNGNLHSGQKKT